jgi:hypothetical protein
VDADHLLDDNDSDADESDEDGSDMRANPPPSFPNRKVGRLPTDGKEKAIVNLGKWLSRQRKVDK